MENNGSTRPQPGAAPGSKLATRGGAGCGFLCDKAINNVVGPSVLCAATLGWNVLAATTADAYQVLMGDSNLPLPAPQLPATQDSSEHK